MARYDLILRGGVCVLPDKTAEADIAIRDGKIAEIGALRDAEASETVDAAGLHILPGVIDTQVHFREPGNEHKEDLETGSRAAIAGGVTAVFEMPNTSPPTTSIEALDDKLSRAAGRMWCHHAFYLGASAGNAADLGEMERHPGCAGVKIFMGSSTGNLLVPDDATLEKVLRSGRRRAAVHSEDEARLEERKPLAERGKVETHPVWRDAQTALRSTRRLLAIAKEAGRNVHVLHVTTGEEMALLSENKRFASVEVTPQHLTLAAPDCYAELGTKAQMNPPIRETAHRDALWQALARGVVDVIGSDHAPHTLEEKSGTYPDTPSGMTGVQTLVPIMLDHVNAGRLSLESFVSLVCSNPVRLFGLRNKGAIAAGNDADLTVVDLSARREITDGWIESRCGWTPFAGRTVTGWPVMTVLDGRIVMQEGELRGPASGRPMIFEGTNEGAGSA